MPRKMATFLLVLAAAYIGLCALLFFFQRSFIYFPHPGSQAAGATTMTLAADDAQVLVTVRPLNGPHAVIYFGGNAEDVSYNLPTFSDAFPGHAIYLLHYRGYGGSSGTPSEAALMADALSLYEQVVAEHKHVTVIGRSLGSGVAIHLASLRPVERLVLVTPFNSMQDLAERHYPYLPVRWLLRDKYESWKYAARVSAPTLLVAAGHDEIIPLASTRALLSHFPKGIARLAIVDGAGHNTISESPTYIPLLRGVP